MYNLTCKFETKDKEISINSLDIQKYDLERMISLLMIIALDPDTSSYDIKFESDTDIHRLWKHQVE